MRAAARGIRAPPRLSLRRGLALRSFGFGLRDLAVVGRLDADLLERVHAHAQHSRAVFRGQRFFVALDRAVDRRGDVPSAREIISTRISSTVCSAGARS